MLTVDGARDEDGTEVIDSVVILDGGAREVVVVAVISGERHC